ncbi:MAG: SsrA-binding protein, partial [Actinomycetota bacterium]
MTKKKSKRKPASNVVASNPKARHDYELLETMEAGIVLTGSEVKSLRAGSASLRESFAVVRGGEVLLCGMHIAPYPEAGYAQHEPTRTRKL